MSNIYMHITSPKGLAKVFDELNNGHKSISFLEHTDFEIRYNEIKPPDAEYQETDRFPNCCPFHKKIIENVQQRISKFPACCDQHSKLANQPWFNKLNYLGLPFHTVKAVHFTEYQILNKINEEDWYEEITEYIEYCVYSFGQFPAGFGPPLALEDYLQFTKWIVLNNSDKDPYPKDRMTKILNYMDGYSEPQPEVKQTDVNILINQYEKWLNIFPFEISYFAPLKHELSSIYPILSGETKINRYLGTHKKKLLTYPELIESIINITKKILGSFSALTLFEEGKLTGIEYKQLDIAGSLRHVELNEIREEIDKNQNKYIKIIKKWLKGEQNYLRTISPILSQSQHNTVYIKE